MYGILTGVFNFNNLRNAAHTVNVKAFILPRTFGLP